MLYVTPQISIDESELDEGFVRAGGPGGQNVNKVSTAVQLRFDAARSKALTDEVRRRLVTLAGRRLTREGVLMITASRFRSQEQNRQDARARLVALLVAAARRPTPRRATKPKLSAKRRTLETKRRRGQIKRWRRESGPAEE